jgi:hypothetical protein
MRGSDKLWYRKLATGRCAAVTCPAEQNQVLSGGKCVCKEGFLDVNSSDGVFCVPSAFPSKTCIHSITISAISAFAQMCELER